MDVSSVGSLSTILNVASMVFPQLAMLSSLTNMLTQAFGDAIKGAVDQLGKEGGMPKFLQDLVKKAVDDALAAAKKESTPEANAATQQQAGGDVKNMQEDATQSIADGTMQNMKGKKSSGTSWLEALAAALGDELNKQAAKLQQMADGITGSGTDQPKQMSELQAASQRFSFMMNAVDQVIKSIGEALSAAARKQ